MKIDWWKETEKRKEEIIRTTQAFLRIKSVLDPETAGDGAPFGKGIAEALEFALQVCGESGMTVKNVDGYAGHAEFGQGTELVGILSHVDVVPEGDGWSVPPYGAEIVDGKIVARGALDDKGPAMAAIFAARIVKELGLPLSRRVRLIFGTDEESGWNCVRTYFEREEMPSMGFSPDADFPIIYAEKGLTHLVWRQTIAEYEARGQEEASAPEAVLVSFSAGLRMNMVPERAKAVLRLENISAEELSDRFRRFTEEIGRPGHIEMDGNTAFLELEGVSVHGMQPWKGVNAGTELIRFLAGMNLDARAMEMVKFTDRYLYRQHYGEALGIAHDDEEMGPLTVNTGVIEYERDGDLVFHVNIRYPHSHPYERWGPVLLEKLKELSLTMGVEDHLPPHRVDPAHPLVTTLQRVYTEQTGQPADLLAIGGATYARSLATGVAFGPLFPGRKDSAHQRDEHILIDDLLKAVALYAEAIYELAKE
jgi:succinyl-diaminopimelate desuccinylase